MTETVIRIPTLETERLVLRAARMSDFDTYAAFRGGARSVTIGGPYNRAQAFDQLAEIVGHWHLRGFGRWMVADRDTDMPLGIVGLFYPEDWPEPEIAWSVFDHAEGRGIAAEAALAARAYAYDMLGWTRVVSVISAGNKRSLALARRLGCARDADFDHPALGAMQVWLHPGPATDTAAGAATATTESPA